ncbi:MAG TPA: peptide chain release factor-like protein [bacterium]|uniref:Peptide chain release factor 1 n=1 Tax=candidate division TA06 bacterium ADurb.Bin417 TaxID=1852828 RepID=A0A1V5MAW8_UNCT6|nr:MAG: Peptide chain release factor 1 [candidate division TA06 bacterium ADurb.Bin417]HNS47927.1 peptide chain release factor-like protein [bacterium]
MAEFPVRSEKAKALARRLAALGVREADLVEKFVRSGGRGGQNLNKTSTCVYLKHRPSGLEIKCQEARSQGLNRYRARLLLAERIESIRLGRLARVRQEREKIRRQKRRRGRRARVRLKEDKIRQSTLKAGRRPVRPEAE